MGPKRGWNLLRNIFKVELGEKMKVGISGWDRSTSRGKRELKVGNGTGDRSQNNQGGCTKIPQSR